MGRLLKHSVIFQGLFLMAFGLFASERMRAKTPSATVKMAESSESNPNPDAHALDVLYRMLLKSEAFRTPVSGLRIRLAPGKVVISLQNEELYSGDSVALDETVQPVLDRIASSLLPLLAPEFQVRVQAFIEGATEEHGVSAFKQETAYSLATKRAEWLLHYLETRHQSRAKGRFWIGAGVAGTNKRIELIIESR
jgi:hypothetical protein